MLAQASLDVALALWFLLDFEERYKWEPWRRPKTLAERYNRTAERYIEKVQELRSAVPVGAHPAFNAAI